jgi:uncharacterized protein YfcZ (UPF0381/DUF406 family)
MVDLTDVRGLFGIVTFKVGVVFDAFSRMTLSVRVFTKEPAAEEIARLVTRTAKRHGRPSHISYRIREAASQVRSFAAGCGRSG